MKAGILYLVRSSEEDVEDFIKSLKSIHSNFLRQFKYPIYAYIEDDFKESFKNKILLETRLDNLFFRTIRFSIPNNNSHLTILDYFPHPTHGNGPIAYGHPGFTVGYRHMCRLFSGAMFKDLKELDELEYYFRLDNDSRIMSSINYDIFEYMKQHNYVYGYHHIENDNPKVTDGLWETYSNFIQQHKITPKHIPEHNKMYATNFEIGNVNWFKTSGYMDFFNYVDNIGGIYTHRWGDAPIKYIGVNMYSNPNQIHNFSDIKYNHGTFKKIENSLIYIK